MGYYLAACVFHSRGLPVDCPAEADLLRFPSPLNHIPVVAYPLDGGTAALIVRAYHAEVVVNDRLPAALHAHVVRHVVERHTQRCRALTCAEARAWLATVPSLPAPLEVAATA